MLGASLTVPFVERDGHAVVAGARVADLDERALGAEQAVLPAPRRRLALGAM
jgi:hypothetical protein